MRLKPSLALPLGSAIAMMTSLSACAQLAEITEPAAEVQAETDAATPSAAAEIQSEPSAEPAPTVFTAPIAGVDGNTIGEFELVQAPAGLMLNVAVNEGVLTPGWHGMHFHDIGDCSDIGTYKLSGGHVGQIEGKHGLLHPEGPNAGDLPNIWAAEDGSAKTQAFTELVDLTTLLEGDGAALVIHAEKDDQITPPIGGAGARVGCGVIAAG